MHACRFLAETLALRKSLFHMDIWAWNIAMTAEEQFPQSFIADQSKFIRQNY